MKKRNTILFAFGCATVFLSLVLFPCCKADAADTSVVTSDFSFKEITHNTPWWSTRYITIDVMNVFLFGDTGFELYSLISNHGDRDTEIKITHYIIKPDGTKEQVSWWQGLLGSNIAVDFWILCIYLDDQYGTYTYLVTVQDMTSNHLLDIQTFSWRRVPV